MIIHRIDHVGIVVNDLIAAKAFFLDFGLKLHGRESQRASGWITFGRHDAKVSYAMLGTLDGGSNIELIQFDRPSSEHEIQPPPVNALGIRHIAFVVDDIEAVVEKLKNRGAEIFDRIQNFDDTFKLCYIRGPEDIILELAEQLDK